MRRVRSLQAADRPFESFVFHLIRCLFKFARPRPGRAKRRQLWQFAVAIMSDPVALLIRHAWSDPW